eukprot:scaffold62517_cov66-Phaeocystis_antarctica.AAC.3
MWHGAMWEGRTLIVELERRVAGLPTKHKGWRETAERFGGVESARGRETLASRSRAGRTGSGAGLTETGFDSGECRATGASWASGPQVLARRVSGERCPESTLRLSEPAALQQIEADGQIKGWLAGWLSTTAPPLPTQLERGL